MSNPPLHCSCWGNGCCPHKCFRLKHRLPNYIAWARGGSCGQGTYCIPQAMGDNGHPWEPPPAPSSASTTPAAAQPWSHWRNSSMRGRALTDFPANSFRKQIYCPPYVSHKYCRFPGGAIYLYLPRIAFELDIEPVSMQWLTLVARQTKGNSLEWAVGIFLVLFFGVVFCFSFLFLNKKNKNKTSVVS